MPLLRQVMDTILSVYDSRRSQGVLAKRGLAKPELGVKCARTIIWCLRATKRVWGRAALGRVKAAIGMAQESPSPSYTASYYA